MTHKPKLTTLCPDCGQLVGVVLDWNCRNGINEFTGRHRRSRHKTRMGLKPGQAPWCHGSRGVVDERVIFPGTEKVSTCTTPSKSPSPRPSAATATSG